MVFCRFSKVKLKEFAVFPRFFSAISAVFPRKRAMFLGTLLFFSAWENCLSAWENCFSAGEKFLSAQKIVWLSFPAFVATAVASLLLGFVGEGCRRVLRLRRTVVGSAGHDEI